MKCARWISICILISLGSPIGRAVESTPSGSGEQAVGDLAVVYAAKFGYDPADATRALQAAIDSGARKVVVENLGTPWIVNPIRLAGDQEVFFEKGVVVEAKRGGFKGTNDCLFTAVLKKNVTLNGEGATFRMWKKDYLGPDYRKAEWRHCVSVRSCTNVMIYV